MVTKMAPEVNIDSQCLFPYLGLARVYRALDDSKQSRKYYDMVTKMAPEVNIDFNFCFYIIISD